MLLSLLLLVVALVILVLLILLLLQLFLLLLPADQREIGFRIGHARSQLQCALVGRDRIRITLHLCECIAAVVVRIGRIAVVPFVCSRCKLSAAICSSCTLFRCARQCVRCCRIASTQCMVCTLVGALPQSIPPSGIGGRSALHRHRENGQQHDGKPTTAESKRNQRQQRQQEERTIVAPTPQSRIAVLYGRIRSVIEHAKLHQIARIRLQVCIVATAIARKLAQGSFIQTHNLHRAARVLHEAAIARWQGRASRRADADHVHAVALAVCGARCGLCCIIRTVAEQQDLSVAIARLRQQIDCAANSTIRALAINWHRVGRQCSKQVTQAVRIVAERRDGECIASVSDQPELSALALRDQLLDLQPRAQHPRWRKIRREHVRGHIHHHNQRRRWGIQRNRQLRPGRAR